MLYLCYLCHTPIRKVISLVRRSSAQQCTNGEPMVTLSIDLNGCPSLSIPSTLLQSSVSLETNGWPFRLVSNAMQPVASACHGTSTQLGSLHGPKPGGLPLLQGTICCLPLDRCCRYITLCLRD